MTGDPFLRAAIEEARAGLADGGIPIGSVLVLDGRIVGRGRNQRVQRGSAVLHAEMDCLENAGRRTGTDYRRATLDVECVALMTRFIEARPELWNEDIGV